MTRLASIAWWLLLGALLAFSVANLVDWFDQ